MLGSKNVEVSYVCLMCNDGMKNTLCPMCNDGMEDTLHALI